MNQPAPLFLIHVDRMYGEDWYVLVQAEDGSEARKKAEVKFPRISIPNPVPAQGGGDTIRTLPSEVQRSADDMDSGTPIRLDENGVSQLLAKGW